MATKMKRFLAFTVALALSIGQIAIPAMAAEADSSQNITVNVAVSQAPAASPDMNVTTGESVTTTKHDTEAGVIEQSTSTTTDWSGTNGSGAAVTGSETVTNVSGTDINTGDTLYQGGSVSGSETTTKTEITTETNTEKDVVLSDETEITTGAENGDPYTEITTETTTKTEEGQWVEGALVEGAPVMDADLSGKESSSTRVDIEIEDPGSVTIDLTPNDGDGTTITKIIPIEDVIAGIITLPAEGTYTEIKDDAGNVIGYEVITTAQNSETKTTENDPVKTVNDYTVTAPVTLPEGVKAGKESVYAEDGETVIGQIVTEVVPTYDADGNVIKYTITKTTTINVDETATEVSDAASSEKKETNTSIRLPEKPIGSVSTDPDTGITTTVTVEEIKDDTGAVTGYAIVTKKTDADGAMISTSTEKKYGTVVTTNITTVTDPTTIETITKAQEVITEVTEITAETAVRETETVTTRLNEYIDTSMTQKEYAYVEIDGKLYFIYTGSMTVTEGEDHGDTSLMQPITPMDSLMKANSALDLDKGGENAVNNTRAPEEGFKYIGYGVDTLLNISKGNQSSEVTQFRLKSADGKEYYALCIDFNTTIKSGHLYDIADITSEDYYQQSGSVDIETAEKIRSVALNGYWGTESDVGSMADVQAFLTDYLVNDQKMTEAEAAEIVNSLTPGQALAATQGALWKFGNKDGQNVVNENNLVPNGWAQEGWGWNSQRVKTEDYTNTEYLYKALLAAANDTDAELEADEGVEFLDAEDITAGAITVKSKVVSEEETHANNDANPDNDVYNTDLSFTLGIEPSKLNGDLIVTVTVGGDQVKKVRLAGADDPLFPLGRIVKNEDGSYTIPDVEIAEGVSVNLNLSGTQDLGTGVYIYTSLEGTYNDSQTLVTLATGSRKVNLDMDMDFSVEEPDATAAKVEGSDTEVIKTVNTRTDTKTDREVSTKTNTKTTYELDYESNGTIQTKVYADVTVEKVTTEETKEERSWFESWMEVFEPEPTEPETEPTEPKDPPHTPAAQDDDYPIDEPELEIPDEEVPLANVPKTGDISLIWAVMSGLSAGGLMLLNRKRED